MNNKIRFFVDQDQVLGDLISAWLDRYNYDYDDNLTAKDITKWNWSDLVKPSCGNKIYEYLDDPTLFEHLPVIENSQEVLYEISQHCEIGVITSPFNINNIIPKHNWLRKHFDFIPEDNFVFVRNKSLVNCDYLLDDKPSNLENGDYYPLLYSAAHNHSENRFTRLNNWIEVRDYFRENIKSD